MDKWVEYDAYLDGVFDFSDYSEYLLDDTIVYGVDYPDSSPDYDLYNLLLDIKTNPDLDNVFSNSVLEGVLPEEMIKKILIEKNFIAPIDYNSKINVKDEAMKMNTEELSLLLKKYGVDASGKKKKLVKLAVKNIPYFEFTVSDFKITDDGEKYLKDFAWISFYDYALFHFSFNEFYKFLDEHDGDYIQLGLKFINQHFKQAYQKEDAVYIDVCYKSKSLIYKFNNNDLMNALNCQLKRFISRLNPQYISYADLFSEKIIIESDMVNNIKQMVEDLKISNLKELFDEIWSQLDFEKVYAGRDESFNYLQRSFVENNHELSDEYSLQYFDAAEEKYDVAMYYYTRQMYDDAIFYFDLSLERSPNQIDALYYKALSYYHIGDIQSILEIADKLLELDDTDSRFYALKAAYYSEDDDKALFYFNKALDLDPNNVFALTNLGIFHYARKNYNKALEYLNKAVEIDDEFINAYIYKFRCYVEMKRWDDAEHTLEQLHNLLGDVKGYYSEYLSYCFASKNYENALKCCDELLQIDEDEPTVWIYKAISLFGLNKKRQAHKCLDCAEELEPGIVIAFSHMFE